MRLFIAINLPDWIRDEIWDSAESMRERRYAIRWVALEAMHITLKFLGEVSVHREDAVKEALEAATDGVTPFVLHLEGFGAFPDARRAKVLWVGCKPPVQLRRLYEKVEESMGGLGFTAETRAFHPHVTLGRLRRSAVSTKLTGLPGMLDRLDFEAEFPVQSIELMQSKLSPAGATYTVRETIGLSG